jgi:hypothetical protein
MNPAGGVHSIVAVFNAIQQTDQGNIAGASSSNLSPDLRCPIRPGESWVIDVNAYFTGAGGIVAGVSVASNFLGVAPAFAFSQEHVHGPVASITALRTSAHANLAGSSFTALATFDLSATTANIWLHSVCVRPALSCVWVFRFVTTSAGASDIILRQGSSLVACRVD